MHPRLFGIPIPLHDRERSSAAELSRGGYGAGGIMRPVALRRLLDCRGALILVVRHKSSSCADMCGIVGAFGRRGRTFAAEELARLRDTMTHRGPDDDGLWLREPADVGFGHRRLSIVDLSRAGRQPMANEDGSVSVTFNGEIYNHEQLRAELERDGHRFRSPRDTEVLVHLYEEHGAEMVRPAGRDVRVRDLGRAARAAAPRARPARDQAALLRSMTARRSRSRSEIKALLPLLRRSEIDQTALCALPDVRGGSAAADAVRRRPASSRRRDDDRQAGRAQEPGRYWDPIADRSDSRSTRATGRPSFGCGSSARSSDG